MSAQRKEQCESLAKRAEAGTGSDRDLDREIGIALGLLFLDDHNVLYRLDPEDQSRVYGGHGWQVITPDFIGSVDAGLRATQRIAPGCFGDVDVSPVPGEALCGARLFPPTEKNGFNFAGEAATPARALIAALLRLHGANPSC
jgi:hypothetical protein